MGKFRKKPVVIEAVQYKCGETLDSAFVNGAHDTFRYTEEGTVLIRTLEGSMEGRPGDWIIKGVNGEFYPCKPDIFAKTYEAVKPCCRFDHDGDGNCHMHPAKAIVP